MEEKPVNCRPEAGMPRRSLDRAEDKPSGSASRRGCRRVFVVAPLIVLAGGAGFVWHATRPLDTTPPDVVFKKVEPDKPLFDGAEQQVTFVLRDDKDGIPTFFIFQEKDHKITAQAINLLRKTPNERGVEIRFEAVRFLKEDVNEPDKITVRAVGIANEMDGNKPILLGDLESGKPLDLNFRDEIKEFFCHVVYEIKMTIQYDSKTQQLSLPNASGSIRWKMPGSDAFDEGRLEGTITGRKGDYDEKPLLDFEGSN